MPQVTKIVIHFDDGSVHEVDPSQGGSIFTSESKAKKCGHNPPYGKPPKDDSSGTTTLMSTSTTGDADASGACYYINGVVVCP